MWLICQLRGVWGDRLLFVFRACWLGRHLKFVHSSRCALAPCTGELVFRRRMLTDSLQVLLNTYRGLTVGRFRIPAIGPSTLCFPRRARRLEHTVKDNPTPKLSDDETLRNFSWRPSESGNASWSGPPAAGRVGAGLVGHTLPSATSVRASAGALPSVASAVRGGRECSTSRGAARCDEGHH